MLTPQQRAATSRIAALTIANAMVFQEVLSLHDRRVMPLRRCLDSPDRVSALCDHWQFILTQIDYVPIFRVARELLLELPASPDIEDAIHFLGQRALDIVRSRAALRHDLMGRVYHRLLAEAKFLGTYYTSVPAATLLLKVALSRHLWQLDWADLERLASFRIGDLACGTGTLLMAAAEAITDNYVSARAEQGLPTDLAQLHRLLMEQVIYGYDVLPSALHLTASTLALRSSDIAFDLTNLYSLPLGGPNRALGSIEFLKSREAPIAFDLFGAQTSIGQVTAMGDVRSSAVLPDLDVCVMNPPFTRSVGGNLLFGSLPETERRSMQRELAKLLQTKGALANSTAGLGSVFVAVADRALKPHGRLALVLPKALLSGVAWDKTRELFRRGYTVEYLIVSHDPQRWNFSENTDLSEVLVVARKNPPPSSDGSETRPEHVLSAVERSEGGGTGPVVCLNLWRNPRTAVEALNIVYTLMQGEPPDLAAGQGALEVRIGTAKAGEALSLPWLDLRDRPVWILPCAFAQADLVRAAYHLLRGYLYLPGVGLSGATGRPPLPLCPLGHLGTLGPDRRDIHDGFSLASGPTAYPAFWGHDAPLRTTFAQIPDRYLSPLPRAKAGRPLRKVQDLWPKAGRVMLAERLWLKTQRVFAVRLNKKALANVWWPFALGQDDEGAEKALVLWLNSTLGLLTLLAHREETRGAWVDFKKPTLAAMPVLDVRALSARQREALAAAFDRLGAEPLLPFPFMADDHVRAEIDRVVAQTLALPDFTVLRQLLAREPVVSLAPLSP